MGSCRCCCSSAGAATSSIDINPQNRAGFQKGCEVLRGAVVDLTKTEGAWRNQPPSERQGMRLSLPVSKVTCVHCLLSSDFDRILKSLLPESRVNRYTVPGLD